MQKGLFVLLAFLALGLGGCATFFELGVEERTPASMDRGYTEEDEGTCSGRFCDDGAEEDREDANARIYPEKSVDLRVRKAIESRDIVLGMTRQEVSASWGEPYSREVAGNGSEGHERWVYGSRYSLSRKRTVYFENGRVAGWFQ